MDTLKKTKGREAVLRVLSDEHVPVDVSHIQDHLDEEAVHIDPATVYRILDAFYKTGHCPALDSRRENSDMNYLQRKITIISLLFLWQNRRYLRLCNFGTPKRYSKEKGISCKVSHT